MQQRKNITNDIIFLIGEDENLVVCDYNRDYLPPRFVPYLSPMEARYTSRLQLNIRFFNQYRASGICELENIIIRSESYGKYFTHQSPLLFIFIY